MRNRIVITVSTPQETALAKMLLEQAGMSKKRVQDIFTHAALTEEEIARRSNADQKKITKDKAVAKEMIAQASNLLRQDRLNSRCQAAVRALLGEMGKDSIFPYKPNPERNKDKDLAKGCLLLRGHQKDNTDINSAVEKAVQRQAAVRARREGGLLGSIKTGVLGVAQAIVNLPETLYESVVKRVLNSNAVIAALSVCAVVMILNPITSPLGTMLACYAAFKAADKKLGITEKVAILFLNQGEKQAKVEKVLRNIEKLDFANVPALQDRSQTQQESKAPTRANKQDLEQQTTTSKETGKSSAQSSPKESHAQTAKTQSQQQKGGLWSKIIGSKHTSEDKAQDVFMPKEERQAPPAPTTTSSLASLLRPPIKPATPQKSKNERDKESQSQGMGGR